MLINFNFLMKNSDSHRNFLNDLNEINNIVDEIENVGGYIGHSLSDSINSIRRFTNDYKYTNRYNDLFDDFEWNTSILKDMESNQKQEQSLKKYNNNKPIENMKSLWGTSIIKDMESEPKHIFTRKPIFRFDDPYYWAPLPIIPEKRRQPNLQVFARVAEGAPFKINCRIPHEEILHFIDEPTITLYIFPLHYKNSLYHICNESLYKFVVDQLKNLKHCSNFHARYVNNQYYYDYCCNTGYSNIDGYQCILCPRWKCNHCKHNNSKCSLTDFDISQNQSYFMKEIQDILCRYSDLDNMVFRYEKWW